MIVRVRVETEKEKQGFGEARKRKETSLGFLNPITLLPHGPIPEIRMKRCRDFKRLFLLRSALVFFRSVVGLPSHCARDVTL